jgi:hypothetical protein
MSGCSASKLTATTAPQQPADENHQHKSTLLTVPPHSAAPKAPHEVRPNESFFVEDFLRVRIFDAIKFLTVSELKNV